MAKNTIKKAKSLSAWFKRTGFHAISRHRFTEPYFDAYTKAFGSALLAWNDLHETLSTLFVVAMGINQFARSFALWHGTRNDIGKRNLLRAAIENLPASEIGNRTTLVADITWILDKSQALEELRDNTAHTPLQYTSTAFQSLAKLLATPPDCIDLKTRCPRKHFFRESKGIAYR